MPSAFSLLLTISLAMTAASAASLSPRATGDTFGLFAYSTGDSGIGGYPVVYVNGSAYIGNRAVLPTDADTLVFFVDDSSTWVAYPNTTANATATFTNATFFVPGPSSDSKQAGFLTDTSSSTDDIITSGWRFYGHVALNEGSDGAWSSLFYALETSTTGLWSLNWNSTGVDDAIAVTIKDTMPPNVD